tara:strand:+ start:11282 stop:13006 length:1725 start_codon:yes stop_codon:yes gene_type:complete
LIIFQKVRWRNFLSTGNVFTEIDLNRSPNCLIVGENGSGKSTVLDALCYGLFAKPFRKVNIPQLVNSVNGKDLTVEVEFKIGSNEYKIYRGFNKYRSNPFELYKNGVLLNQEAKNRDYQKFLEENILKLNYNSFTQIVILGSSTFVPFMQLKAADRREIIEDILDIKIFSFMNTLLKEKISTNKNDMTDVDYKIKIEEEKKFLIEEQVDSLKADKQELLDKMQADIDDANNKIKFHRENVDAAMIASQDLLSKIKDEDKADKQLRKITKLEDQLENKKSTLKKELVFYETNDTCPTCHQQITEDHKARNMGMKGDKLNEVELALEKLGAEYTKVQARVNEIYEIHVQIQSHQEVATTENANVNALMAHVKILESNIKDTQSNFKDVAKENKKLLDLDKKLAKLIAKKKEIRDDNQVLDVASVLLRDKGIKQRIVKQYVPIMNKLVNKYLAAMEFFVKFELNEKFEETIKSRHRDDFSYDSFSEGEKMRIDLALLFTWRAIAKMKNSTNTNLLVLDEVFDSSLDTEGMDAFLKLIHEIGLDSNVFVISHKGDILQDKFYSSLRFEKHKNFSRIAA